MRLQVSAELDVRAAVAANLVVARRRKYSQNLQHGVQKYTMQLSAHDYSQTFTVDSRTFVHFLCFMRQRFVETGNLPSTSCIKSANATETGCQN